MDSKSSPSTIYTAEADAAFLKGHWARAAALYDEALDAMPQATRQERIEWSRVVRLQQSAADSAALVGSVRRS